MNPLALNLADPASQGVKYLYFGLQDQCSVISFSGMEKDVEGKL
jgi:hypothetical protein